MDGLLAEMNRVRELKQIYQGMPMGFVGASLMQISINKAEQSIAQNNVIAMMVVYED